VNPIIKRIAEWLADEFGDGNADTWKPDAIDFYNYLASHDIRVSQAKRGSVGQIKERAVF
jgi:hypothetical protein